MKSILSGTLAALALAVPALAQVPAFPPGFQTRDIAVQGVTLHVRTGGQGPAVLMLHGYGETGDMWAPLAAELARDHTVVVPDLRGMGLSCAPRAATTRRRRARTWRSC